MVNAEISRLSAGLIGYGGFMKTCNTGNNCNYKTLDGTFTGCCYGGYCDYQCPKDFRTHTQEPSCCCGGQANTAGRCNICGLRKH